MLNERTEIPKFRFALLDWSVFSPDEEKLTLNLELIRMLIHRKNPSWKIRYLYTEQAKFRAEEIRHRLDDMGLHFWDETCLPVIPDVADLQMLIYECDLAYIPLAAKNLPVNFLLRTPYSAKVAVEAICYFSSSAEPFTKDNYYKFLSLWNLNF